MVVHNDKLVIPRAVRDLLIQQARAAAQQAYCPYSHYPVGAAVLTADGAVYTGCNVENASYGLTVCAERIAVFKAISHGHRDVVALAVVGGTPRQPATPCGACLQVLAEFADAHLPIFIRPLKRGCGVDRLLGELLPVVFQT
jgi:cytidine deaminase